MDFKLFDNGELHITTYDFLKYPFITFNDERYELVHFELDRNTKKRTYFFVKGY